MTTLNNNRRSEGVRPTHMVPVYPHDTEPAGAGSTASGTLGPILAFISLSFLLFIAVAASMGLFKSPEQEMVVENQNLEGQLTEAQAELNRINACITGE